MLARLVLGAVTAGAMVVPALAGMMNADEARRFVSGKVFAFTCFDGTRGAGRILDDMGAAGSIQFSGSGPMRHVRLPGNTLQVRGQSVCASHQGSSVRAVLQSRQARREHLPRIGFGHGLRLLRIPSPGCGSDADGARRGPATLAASARSRHARRTPRIPKYRHGSRRRLSRAPNSSRSNPRPRPSRRSRRALRNCAARPIEFCIAAAQIAWPDGRHAVVIRVAIFIAW